MKSNVMSEKALTSLRKSLNVENAVSGLDESVNSLRSAVNDLESTLAPLLGPERPAGVGCDREAGASEVAERIMANSNSVFSLTERIRDLIERM